MINQGLDENPTGFLERIRGALERKYKKKTEAIIATFQAHRPQSPQDGPANCYKCGKTVHFRKDFPDSRRKPS